MRGEDLSQGREEIGASQKKKSRHNKKNQPIGEPVAAAHNREERGESERSLSDVFFRIGKVEGGEKSKILPHL